MPFGAMDQPRWHICHLGCPLGSINTLNMHGCGWSVNKSVARGSALMQQLSLTTVMSNDRAACVSLQCIPRKRQGTPTPGPPVPFVISEEEPSPWRSVSKEELNHEYKWITSRFRVGASEWFQTAFYIVDSSWIKYESCLAPQFFCFLIRCCSQALCLGLPEQLPGDKSQCDCTF